eukprot:scaffold346333_cov30-Prasinocladus_malaysianus.AAC.1
MSIIRYFPVSTFRLIFSRPIPGHSVSAFKGHRALSFLRSIQEATPGSTPGPWRSDRPSRAPGTPTQRAPLSGPETRRPGSIRSSPATNSHVPLAQSALTGHQDRVNQMYDSLQQALLLWWTTVLIVPP